MLSKQQLHDYANWLGEYADDSASSTQAPKRGEAIFQGTDYPRTWDGFVGQEDAKEQLRIQIASATARKARLEHTLLASGAHGIGKSTLATLLAYSAGVGIVQTSGPLLIEDARRLMRAMKDRDVLFIDEVHTLVAGNRNKADWLLPFMTEGKLYTENGAEKMPNITIVAATTDVGKLPQTLISRFMVQPVLVPYSTAEGARIAGNLSRRMDIPVGDAEVFEEIAEAADNNPRSMRRILTAIRDLSYAYPETHPNLEKAFEWSGVSRDGLSMLAREMLIVLLTSKDGTASVDTLKAQLGEPGPIAHEEQTLLRRSYITISGRGRVLTDAGRVRALEVLTELRAKAH